MQLTDFSTSDLEAELERRKKAPRPPVESWRDQMLRAVQTLFPDVICSLERNAVVIGGKDALGSCEGLPGDDAFLDVTLFSKETSDWLRISVTVKEPSDIPDAVRRLMGSVLSRIHTEGEPP